MKNFSKAFSLPEVLTVVTIIGISISILASAIKFNEKREYEIKFKKTSAIISANIEKNILQKTGFKFSDYTSDTYKTAAIEGLNYNSCNLGTCWSNNAKNFTKGENGIISDGGNNIQISNSWSFVKLNNNVVLAFDNKSTTIMIDVNGEKGPNKAEKDIRLYKAPLN